MENATNTELKKTYKLSSGIAAHQEELSLGQDYKLAALISTVEIESMDDLKKMKVHDLIKLLSEQCLIEKFLLIVLIPEEGQNLTEDGIKKLKNSEVKQILEDFFQLNPLLRDWLTNIAPALATQTTSLMSSSSEQTAENTTQDS